MSSLPEIKRRLSSVKQTCQITGAMKTVSAAKMRSAQAMYEHSTEFLRLLKSAASGVKFGSVLPEPKDGDDVMIVVSSDRGLCGAFDNEVIRQALHSMDERTIVMPIGLIAAGKLGGRNNVDMRFTSRSQPDYSAALAIASALLDMYGNGVKRVSIAYSRLSAGSSVPVIKQLLPFTADLSGDMAFELVDDEAVATLVPMYLAAQVYAALSESFTAEQRARYAAMSAATDSANGMIEQLSLEYNRARQATVTEQITEIVGATTALKESVYNEKRN